MLRVDEVIKLTGSSLLVVLRLLLFPVVVAQKEVAHLRLGHAAASRTSY